MTGDDASADLRLLVGHLRPERARLVALVAVLLVASIAPILGPVLLGRGIDDALAGEPASTIVAIGVAYLAVTLGADVLQVLVAWWSVRLAWRVGNRVRLDLARHALGLDLGWHSRHRAGLLIERIDGDVEAIVKFSSTAVLQMLGNGILVFGVVVASLIIDWRAGLLIAVAVAAGLVVMVRFRGAAVPAYDAEREVQGELYGDLEERLGGLEDLRANGAGAYAVHRLRGHSARWWRATRQAGLVGGAAHAGAAVAFSLGAVATLGLGIWQYQRGELSLGSVVALFRFSQLVRQPIERLAEQLTMMQKAAAGARRAARLLATESRLPDVGVGALPSGPLSLDLDRVSLTYGAAEPVLVDVDLHVSPGTTVGIVGRTGSGKTSLGRLVSRLWDVDDGQVRLGDVDVRTVPVSEMRRAVAVVNQDVELFRASLRDNLTLFGYVDAPDDRLWWALAEVGLGEWAAGLLDGLDTELGEREGLSAGESQLVAFARLLLTDPGLVVLDEATARLDPATESLVALAADRALAGRTVLIIAHRLATLDGVDEIVVLERGRLVEHGPRDELAADPSSRYARLLAVAGAGALA